METQDFTARETEYQMLRNLMRCAGQERGIAKLFRTALQEELTERQEQMVRMYYIEQHTMREIAALLEVNVSTVSRTLSAARRKLRRVLKYTDPALLR